MSTTTSASTVPSRGEAQQPASGSPEVRLAGRSSTELRDAWRNLMASHARVSEALEHALQRRHGLSLNEFEVLQRLTEAPKGYRRMQELAEEIHLSPSALTRLVGRLEKAGLAYRDICEDDRRGIYATLTDAGRAAHREAEPTHQAILAETL